MKKKGLEEFLDQQVTLYGIARDAKGGAVLITAEEIPIYIENIASWPPELHYKKITAIGVLKKKKLIPDPKIDKNGGISQGAIGMQLVLEKAEFFLKENI
ncbi:MAG: hypothetical protein ACFE8P_12255 [Promethearchaeota archaeon]